jgi:hypothetical protein
MVQLPPLFCRLCRFGGIGAIALTLFSCDSPERLPSDLSMENSKDVLRERVIAPIKGIDEDEITAFEPLPRRKLL